MKLISKRLALLMITFSVVSALNISTVSAQSAWHSWFKIGNITKNTADKTVATQVDYPEHCTNFGWDGGGSVWDTTSQTTFVYNPNGGLLERIVAKYSSGSFTNDFREMHFYDVLGNDSLTLAYSWNGGAWESSYRFLRTFDPFGNITSSIGQIWNGVAWDTSSGYRAIFTYHNTDQIAAVTQENYQVGSGWEPTYRMEYSFDNQNRWDTVTGFNPDQGGWLYDRRMLDLAWHDFSKNQPDSAKFEEYINSWENLQRFRVTYSQFDSQVWIYDKFATVWDPAEKYIFNYDQYGNEVQNEGFAWTGIWSQVDGTETNYLYGTSGEKLEVWQSFFDGIGYVNDNRQVYADFFTHSADIEGHTLSAIAFPNPVISAKRLSFQISDLKHGPTDVSLFDANGVLRLNTHRPSNELIDIELPASLENGIYFYRIQTGNRRGTGKVVIQR